jgi:hypothetical protein
MISVSQVTPLSPAVLSRWGWFRAFASPNLSILLPCVVVPMMVQLLGPLQCGVLAYVQSVVACSSAAEAGMFGAWMWFGFTLPCFHHDTWTSRSVKGTVLSQSVEAVGSVLFSVAIFALPRFLDGVWVILTH